MFELCEGRRAYNSEHKTYVPTIHRPYSEGLKRLIRDCMSINAAHRLDTHTLRQRFAELESQLSSSPQRRSTPQHKSTPQHRSTPKSRLMKLAMFILS